MEQALDDPVWVTLRDEARRDAADEPLLASFLHMTILNHRSLERSLAFHLANKLASATLQPILLMELFTEALESDAAMQEAMRADIRAVKERDPACRGYSVPFLYFKGFQAIQAYRIGHWLWQHDRIALALALQSRVSEAFGVDLHPAARVGKGLLFDHATGIVVGETAVIGDNVSMLHEVTLGGTGKETGDRHPKIGHGVLIGAGAKILGNVRVGDGARIGASSVVLEDIPPHVTAVGVPATVIGPTQSPEPALEMDHRFHCGGDGI